MALQEFDVGQSHKPQMGQLTDEVYFHRSISHRLHEHVFGDRRDDAALGAGLQVHLRPVYHSYFEPDRRLGLLHRFVNLHPVPGPGPKPPLLWTCLFKKIGSQILDVSFQTSL